ncbi:MAG: hypothetical protein P4L92_13340 [Rudaea sp.]|nr:hypothetical protein [Rudaea sp.]
MNHVPVIHSFGALAVLLAALIGPAERLVAATVRPDAVCIVCTIPYFSVSAMSADDAGGIYNGSTIALSVTMTNGGGVSGPWQAELSIPSGYSFVDTNPADCGGAIYYPIPRPDGAKSMSSIYLVWPSGTDGNGTGDGGIRPSPITAPARSLCSRWRGDCSIGAPASSRTCVRCKKERLRKGGVLLCCVR